MPDVHFVLGFLGLAFGGAAGVALAGRFRRGAGQAPQTSGNDAARNTAFVFSGSLRQTSLLEAVQFLEIGGREGILHVYSGRRKGYLIFSKGKVIDAFYRNQTGRDGIFTMLSLDEGDFYFEPKTIVQPRLISESIVAIALAWDAQRNAGRPANRTS